jgi:SAM-dependent methyltransferase
MSELTIANQEQREFWSDIKGDLWVTLQPRIDTMLATFGDKALDTLNPQSGERILEIGCGTGTTTLALGGRVGTSGEILAADLSRPMLNKAIERANVSAEHPITFVEADAQVHSFPTATFDAVYSRFGVMFFDDPIAAFRNIRKAVRPGGRMAYVCWADRKANPWIRIPAGAAKTCLDLPAPPPDDAPGQFSMENEGRVQQILHDAGWSDIGLERFTVDGSIGSDAADAARFITKMGPMSEPFALADSDTQNKTLQVIEEALTPYSNDSGVTLGFSTWIVSAMQA